MNMYPDIATGYGADLIVCENQFEASYYYHEMRGQCLQKLKEISKLVDEFEFDFSPDSLKIIELLYYDVEDQQSFSFFNLTKEEFERCLGVYLGEVVVRNIEKARWVVREYSLDSSKFLMGIEKGKFALMLPYGYREHKERYPHFRFTLYRDFLQFKNHN